MGGPDRAAFQVCGAGKEAVRAETPPEGNSSGASIGAGEAGNFEANSLNVYGHFWTRPAMPKITAPTAQA
jgi:hypothetical protein